MAETAISLAFERANAKAKLDPGERALALAIDAWAKWPQVAATGARVNYMRDRLAGEMTFAFVDQRRPAALRESIEGLLNYAARRIADSRPDQNVAKATGGEGRSRLDSQGDDALPATTSPNAGRPAGGPGHTGRDNQTASARSAPSLTELADKQAARGDSRAATAIQLCRLDTVLIDGKPIGDCIVSEVRVWANQRVQDAKDAERDTRFALSLIANLPGNAVVRRFVSPAEADAYYSRAENEHAA